MLPLGGLFIAIFAGWVMSKQSSQNELAIGEGAGYNLWLKLVCYITPVGVSIVFLHSMGLI